MFNHLKHDIKAKKNIKSTILAFVVNNLKVPTPYGIDVIPFAGTVAIAIDYGGNLVGAEMDLGIILILRGKQVGEYMFYDEIEGGMGTGGNLGYDIVRYDYTGGYTRQWLSGQNQYTGQLGITSFEYGKSPRIQLLNISDAFVFGYGLKVTISPVKLINSVSRMEVERANRISRGDYSVWAYPRSGHGYR